MLGVAATTATAGIIVGVVTLTGLGLKLAGVIVTLAGGTLALTVIYSAIAVWMLGLAVPVTASYIIAAVMVAPALVQSGVPDFAAHMFIFYYAVLSEVSPPTALSPFAAAALTGGNPVQDDDPDVEVHAAGVRRPVGLHAAARGDGDAPARPHRNVVLSRRHRRRRDRRARRRLRRLASRPAEPLAPGPFSWFRAPPVLYGGRRRRALAGSGLLVLVLILQSLGPGRTTNVGRAR